MSSTFFWSLEKTLAKRFTSVCAPLPFIELLHNILCLFTVDFQTDSGNMLCLTAEVLLFIVFSLHISCGVQMFHCLCFPFIHPVAFCHSTVYDVFLTYKQMCVEVCWRCGNTRGQLLGFMSSIVSFNTNTCYTCYLNSNSLIG